MNKVIKTNDLVNFCGGCSWQIHLQRFIAVDEAELFESAWERRHEAATDELFSRSIYLGRCLCGNVFLHKTIHDPPLSKTP